MTKKKIGGYEFRQHIVTARNANQEARRITNRVLTENPGPQTLTVLVARLALELANEAAALHEIELITKEGDPT